MRVWVDGAQVMPSRELRTMAGTEEGQDQLMHQQIQLDASTLADFCRFRGIQKLSLFGSTLRGTNRPDSDLDLLVEFAPDTHPTLFDLATMESDLSRMLGGRRVDLRTPAELSRHFRDDVVRQAKVQYVAG
jgi:uncharacterized protein